MEGSETQDNWVLRSNNELIYSRCYWSLSSISQISEKTSIYTFTNPIFTIKLNPLGVGWIGKLFIIGNENFQRIYTQCLALDEQCIQFRKTLIALSKSPPKSNSPVLVEPSVSSTLSFAISRVRHERGFSSQLAHSETHSRHYIEGPFVRLLYKYRASVFSAAF